jgi:hypothetical protein
MPNAKNYPPVITCDLTATIAASASLSGVVDLKGTTIVGYVLPSAWTAADITLSASVDGTNFFDVYNQYGVEIKHTVAASRYVVLTASDLASFRYFKFRSGTTGTPVTQAAERIITIVARAV